MKKLAIATLVVGCVALAGAALRATLLPSEGRGERGSDRAVRHDVGATDALPGAVLLALRARIAYLEARLTESEDQCHGALAVRGRELSPVASADDDATAGARAAPAPPPLAASTITGSPAARGAFRTIAETAANEPPDPEWSPAAERELRSLLGALQPAAALESAHCGARLCRLEIRHPPDSDPTARLTGLLAGAPAFSPQRLTEPAPPSAGTTIVLLARSGTTMPLITAGGDDEGGGSAE